MRSRALIAAMRSSSERRAASAHLHQREGAFPLGRSLVVLAEGGTLVSAPPMPPGPGCASSQHPQRAPEPRGGRGAARSASGLRGGLGMSLRGLLTGAALLLLVAVVGSALALAGLLRVYERSVALLSESISALTELDRAESDLREVTIAQERRAVPPDPRTVEAERAAVERLRENLHRMGRFVDGVEERAEYERFDRAIEALLAQAPPAGGGAPPGNTADALRIADDAKKRLLDINLRQAMETTQTAARVETWERVLSGASLTLLVLAVVLLLWGARRVVYQPLQTLHDSLARFQPGEPFRPAPETGVVELREVAHTFNDLAGRLVQQRETALKFLAAVAHDLRNPLSALRTTTALLGPGRPPRSEAWLTDKLALVRRQVDLLQRLVEDLLDTTRIEAGQLELRLAEADLAGLVRDAVALHTDVSPLHVLVLELPEGPVPLRCDATRISQVLNNLLSNAIKYSPAGGEVRVTLVADAEGATVSVRDQGVGVAPEEQERIFEPFRRSSATRDAIPGVGLGLAVARRIVQAHGGHIDVESALGRGSTFRVWLPRTPRTLQ